MNDKNAVTNFCNSSRHTNPDARFFFIRLGPDFVISRVLNFSDPAKAVGANQIMTYYVKLVG